VISAARSWTVLPRRVALLRVDGTRVDDAALRRADRALVQRVVDGWIPHLLKHRTPDAGWRWAEKTSESELCYTKGVEHLMITHGGQVQAVMITSLPEEPPPLSRLPDLVYVEYVAVAPWNRRLPGESQQFMKIGQRLIAVAAERSECEGRGGRIGLHSEPDPNTLNFYAQKVLLESRGPDADQEDREYFEGTPRHLTTPTGGGSHGT